MADAKKEARAIDPRQVRDASGETRFGMRVAAYRETHPEHGDKFGHRYSEHWSTPNWNNPSVKVNRLYTEDQFIASLAEKDAEIDTLRKELHLTKSAGIIEIPVRNPSVSDYMSHWERRAEASEARVVDLEKALEDLCDDCLAPDFNNLWDSYAAARRVRDGGKADG